MSRHDEINMFGPLVLFGVGALPAVNAREIIYLTTQNKVYYGPSGSGVWHKFATYPDGINPIIDDGSVPLSANWDAGSFEIRALTFESDVATGTPPFVVASTDTVTNLSADTVDGIQSTSFVRNDAQASNTITGFDGSKLTLKATVNDTSGESDLFRVLSDANEQLLSINAKGKIAWELSYISQFDTEPLTLSSTAVGGILLQPTGLLQIGASGTAYADTTSAYFGIRESTPAYPLDVTGNAGAGAGGKFAVRVRSTGIDDGGVLVEVGDTDNDQYALSLKHSGVSTPLFSISSDGSLRSHSDPVSSANFWIVKSRDDTEDIISFMPGADTGAAGAPTLSVGINTLTPFSVMALDVNGHVLLRESVTATTVIAGSSSFGAGLVTVSDGTGTPVMGFSGSTSVGYILGELLLGTDITNANVTTGLTIQQNAADDHVFAAKSSDVAHGITTIAETDTYGAFMKSSGASGGFLVRGFSEATAGIHLQSYGTSDNTDKTTSAVGYTTIDAFKADGTGTQSPGADANLVVIRNGFAASAKWLVDIEGDTWQAGTITSSAHYGGTASGDDLTLESTTHGTKGQVRIQPTSGSVLIGTTTASADITTGLVIHQESASDFVMAFKATGDEHDMTVVAEENTFGFVSRISSGGGGGLRIAGLSRTGTGLKLSGYAPNDNTAKNSGTTGYVSIDAFKDDTVGGTQSPGADANLMVIRDGDANATKFIFDQEGDSHEDGTGWTAYDDYDDLALLDLLDRSLDQKLRSETGAWLLENEFMLESARIVKFNKDTNGIPFINKSRLSMLLVGALRQAGSRIQRLEDQVKLLLNGYPVEVLI